MSSARSGSAMARWALAALVAASAAAACRAPVAGPAPDAEGRASRATGGGTSGGAATPKPGGAILPPTPTPAGAGPGTPAPIVPVVPLGTTAPATGGPSAGPTPGLPASLPLDRPAAAPLISDKGLGVFPGGAIVSNNGAGVISNNGGNLTGEVRLPALAGAFRLLALADRAAPGLTVRLLSERGVPYGPTTTTDASGAFRFEGLPPTLPFVVVEATDGARKVRALAQAPAAGVTGVTLDAASTGATALALVRLEAEVAPALGLAAEGYVAAVTGLRAKLGDQQAASMLTSDRWAAAELARAALGADVPALVGGPAALGPFVASGASLAAARQFGQAVAIGPWLHVIGDGTPGVVRAPIGADGRLGAFDGAGLTQPALNLTQHAVARTVSHVYVLGGRRGGTPSAAVARAPIGGNDTLGPLEDLPVSLQRPRSLATAIVSGGFLYVLGGGDDAGIIGTIERAQFLPDGSLGPFSNVGSLAVPRIAHTAHRIGPYVYLVGGWSFDGTARAEARVERAPIAADGALGAFEVVPGRVLSTARYDHAAAVVGERLYVMGGAAADPLSGTAPALTAVEAAQITPSGDLEAFAPVVQVLPTARKRGTALAVGGSLYLVGGVGTSTVDAAAITRP